MYSNKISKVITYFSLIIIFFIFLVYFRDLLAITTFKNKQLKQMRLFPKVNYDCYESFEY